MGKFIDLTGQKFGRLTVVKRCGSRYSRALWLCVCDCGNEILADSGSLRTQNTRSCGCIKKERIATMGRANKKHGMFGTRLYMEWADMKRRCTNVNFKSYALYGGRGIKFCEEWDDFIAFQQWAESNGYRDNLTLDRIDPDGNYCPENCRWVTMAEQQNNRRNNHLLTYNGKTQTVSQWAKEVGLPYITLLSRINQLGWDTERALTTKTKDIS